MSCLIFFAASLLDIEPVQSQITKKFQRYCAFTQSDDCIFVDANGYWWDSEPSLEPVYKKVKKLSIKVVGHTKIVQLGNRFFCTKGNERAGKSYLTCTANGWSFIN